MKQLISCHTVRQTTLLSSLQKLLEMSAFCPYTRSKTLTPPVNCIVNDALVHAGPNVQQTLLQFVNAVQLRLMHLLLDVTPYLVIDRIKVGAIRWPQALRNESGRWLLKKSQCRVPGVQVRCLVKRWRNRLTRHASRATVAVTGACRGNSRRWSLLPDRQRWGLWGQALRCRWTP